MSRTELLKIAKPILFNTEMVKAILDGRKTVTRRNPFQFEFKEGQNPNWSGYSLGEYYTGHIETGACLYSRGAHEVWGVRTNVVKPKYHIGDILYVRETFYKHNCARNECIMTDYHDCNGCTHTRKGECYAYRASHEEDLSVKWKPSIHMPKEAARIFLRVTDVRVERLHDITVEQAIKEGLEGGIKCDCHFGCEECLYTSWAYPADYEFALLWDSTIKKQDLDKYGWDTNPWVWVYEFERINNNENNND